MPAVGLAQTYNLSLEQCQEMALENNPDILNSHLDVYAAKAQKQEALAEYFPKVSLSAFSFYAFDPLLEIGVTDILGKSDFSYNLQNMVTSLASAWGFDPVYSTLEYGVTASVSVMQPVFAGGRIVNGNRLAALGVEAAGLQENMQKRSVAEDVEKGYWQVVSLEEKMRTLDRLQTLVDTLYKDVSSACEAGLVTENDLLQVQLRRNELRSGKIQLKSGIRLAKMNLFNSVGVQYSPYVSMATDSLPYIDWICLSEQIDSFSAPEQYFKPEDEIVANLDEKRLLDLSVESKRLEKKMAAGEAMPQIGIGASYGYGRLINDGRMNGAVYAMVSIPISDWGKTARKMQRYDYQLQKAANERDYLNEQLLLQVRKLWIDLNTAWDQLQIAKESVEVAEASVASQLSYYEAGLSPMSDLLQSQAQLQNAGNEYIDQCMNYRNALRAYLGRIGE